MLCNTGADKAVIFSLPPAESGLRYTVVRTAAPAVVVEAAKGDHIGKADRLVSGKKAERSAVLTLIAVDAERWVVTGATGTWEPAKR